MFIYKVVSVLISESTAQSFSGLVDSYGNAVSKNAYTDSSGAFTDNLPEVVIGLIPPFSGNSNEIDGQYEPEPILIIKPPPFTRKPKTTKTYTTAPTFATTRAPVTFRTNPPPTFAPATFRTNPPPTFIPVTARTNPPTFAPVTQRTQPAVAPIFRTTQAPRIFSKSPAPFVPRQQTFANFRVNDEVGKFRGKSEDGTYRPKGNNGAYVHDNSGAYRHTSAGQYKHDDRGKYRKN
jgi:hypothetical protein